MLELYRPTRITIEPVAAFPAMFVVRYPDGVITPMANLARCKAAAVEYARAHGLTHKRHAPKWLRHCGPARGHRTGGASWMVLG
jgi:hypothetical protein